MFDWCLFYGLWSDALQGQPGVPGLDGVAGQKVGPNLDLKPYLSSSFRFPSLTKCFDIVSVSTFTVSNICERKNKLVFHL